MGVGVDLGFDREGFEVWFCCWDCGCDGDGFVCVLGFGFG